jgi:hypothetical protein
MDIILQPFAVFVWHLERSALVAVLFLVGWLLVRKNKSPFGATPLAAPPAGGHALPTAPHGAPRA